MCWKVAGNAFWMNIVMRGAFGGLGGMRGSVASCDADDALPPFPAQALGEDGHLEARHPKRRAPAARCPTCCTNTPSALPHRAHRLHQPPEKCTEPLPLMLLP